MVLGDQSMERMWTCCLSPAKTTPGVGTGWSDILLLDWLAQPAWVPVDATGNSNCKEGASSSSLGDEGKIPSGVAMKDLPEHLPRCEGQGEAVRSPGPTGAAG